MKRWLLCLCLLSPVSALADTIYTFNVVGGGTSFDSSVTLPVAGSFGYDSLHPGMGTLHITAGDYSFDGPTLFVPMAYMGVTPLLFGQIILPDYSAKLGIWIWTTMDQIGCQTGCNSNSTLPSSLNDWGVVQIRNNNTPFSFDDIPWYRTGDTYYFNGLVKATSVAAVPEPGTWLLLLSGLIPVFWLRRIRQ